MTTPPIEENSPRKSSRKWWVYVILAVILVLALVVWRLKSAGRPMGRGAKPPPTALPVVVHTAALGDIDVYLEGLGTVTPLATVTLRTQINGQLTKVAFTEGQMVEKGAVLATIDPRPYQAALEQYQGQLQQAQAQLAEARIDLSRYETLSEQDSIAKQQVDSARALVTQYEGLVQTGQANVDSAKLNLVYCQVIAPVAGRVGLRMVDEGNYVTPGDANGLVVLTRVKPITVIFTIPEQQMLAVAARLHSGATIPVDAFDQNQTRKLASGSLSAIDNQVDTTTGTFRLRAVFANEDESLFPNQFVNVRMLLDTQHGVIVIPTAGIERNQLGTFVYIVKPDNTVTIHPVTLGTTEGEHVAVVSGLKVGDRVVVDGADRLTDGVPVTVQAAK
jgi:multidrug efflux system membrane fusion protein